MLYQPAKRVQVVMLEGGLRARVAAVPALAGQLDAILQERVNHGPSDLTTVVGLRQLRKPRMAAHIRRAPAAR